MRILALEAYYGGSHRSFLDNLCSIGSYEWTVLTLPPHKWKWRMRHSAVTFAQQVSDLQNQAWDMIFCTDMLNLAEFLGLVPEAVRKLPKIAYFHENQLTYPVRIESERDYQYVMTNMTTALAADEVWFNSAFHRDDFLVELEGFLKRMPDHQPVEAIGAIRRKAEVYHPPVNLIKQDGRKQPGPLRILWSGRWEHDKNPEDFFEALKRLKSKGCDFRLIVLGEHFRDVPEVFAWARDYFAEHIDHWGYQDSRGEYEAVLCQADVVVSTAMHEFFGISVIEAISAGAYPVLPDRLAYPEILKLHENENSRQYYYGGSIDKLVDKLKYLCELKASEGSLEGRQKDARQLVDRFSWSELMNKYEQGLLNVATGNGNF